MFITMKKRREDIDSNSRVIPAIPTENVMEILNFLDSSDLCRLRLVNKGFKKLAESPTVKFYSNLSFNRILASFGMLCIRDHLGHIKNSLIRTTTGLQSTQIEMYFPANRFIKLDIHYLATQGLVGG